MTARSAAVLVLLALVVAGGALALGPSGPAPSRTAAAVETRVLPRTTRNAKVGQLLYRTPVVTRPSILAVRARAVGCARGRLVARVDGRVLIKQALTSRSFRFYRSKTPVGPGKHTLGVRVQGRRCSQAVVVETATLLPTAASLPALTPAPAVPGAPAPVPAPAPPPAASATTACPYSDNRISQLVAFEQLVGRPATCALVFNDAAATWSSWERPYFTRDPAEDVDWPRWKAAGTGRTLVVTQGFFPKEETGADRLERGAAGAFDDHARALARNLVAAGLGDATIRLAHEANGSYYPWAVGASQAERDAWRATWRREVLAMKGVEGARFRFDWCVNSAFRPIPFASWYPGDDVVDVIGVDVYDDHVPPGQDRWPYRYTQALGVGDVRAFAEAHGKPMSVPEWGLTPPQDDMGGGDDPAFVAGVAALTRDARVAYQGYFFKGKWGQQLRDAPQGLAAYRSLFPAPG